MLDVTEQIWRPFGVDTEDEIAEYDALHDGVPDWMKSAYWRWVLEAMVIPGHTSIMGQTLDRALADRMCQSLRIPWMSGDSLKQGSIGGTIQALMLHSEPLAVADYLLAFCDRADADALDRMLENAGSAWTVGTRLGHRGLVRRVPAGVQEAADAVMTTAGRAGVRLAKAWGELYGIDPDPSAAYSLAIKAVEDAAIPVVSPNNGSATLGTVLGQIRQQGNWRLPIEREDDRAPSQEVLLGMLQVLWSGQHDRHGGQPSGPGDVSIAEATVAVSLAVTLVNLFHAGLVSRES